MNRTLLLLLLWIPHVALHGQTKSWTGTSTNAWLAQSPRAMRIGQIGSNWRVFVDFLSVTNAITGSVTGSAGSAPAGALTGNTLSSGVTASSLTSVGTLANLTVTSTIGGSVSGSAGFLSPGSAINGVNFTGTGNITVAAAAGTLTGSTLAAGVTASSLTSVGTLGALTVMAPISGSVTGNSGTTTALQTGRTINGVTFDGTGNITITAAGSTLSDTVPISKGGTGQTNAASAFDVLRPSTLITYTGTPLKPIYFSFSPNLAVIPASTTSGQATYSAQGGPTLDQFVYIEGASVSTIGLLTISLDNVVGINTLSIQTCQQLTSISFPTLTVLVSSPTIATLPLLTTFSFPNLESCMSSFSPNTFAVLTTLSLPSLKYIGGSFSPTTMASLTSISANLLEDIGTNFAPTTMASLPTLSFPAMKYLGGSFTPSSMAAVTNISFPAMVAWGSANAGTFSVPSASMGNVASFVLGTVGTLKSITYTTLTLSGLKIPSAGTGSVNDILALLVSLDGTGGTTTWGSGKTLLINGGSNGAPTGQGITDKATLVGRGATVTTN